MPSRGKIPEPDFFARPTLIACRELLGMILVRRQNDQRLSGIITETEAYIGETDLACHARSGKTFRNSAMYGPPGHAYVYFTYGIHWMLNIVTEIEGYPAAILIRAIKPIEGLSTIHRNRNGLDTKGPAKLTQALDIDNSFNEVNLCKKTSDLWIEYGYTIPDRIVTTGPRVGLNKVPEPWKSIPWRFKANLETQLEFDHFKSIDQR